MSSILITHVRIFPRRFSYPSGVYYCNFVRATSINRFVTPTTRVSTLCLDSQVKASTLQSLKYVTPTGLQSNTLNRRYMSSQKETKQSFWQSISQLDRVKQTLRDYGVVAVVFHISMSLCVLAGMYTLVDNGVDVEGYLVKFGFHSAATKGLSTFAAAYILYKFTLPIRAAVTITCAPLIVRSLRARGWIAQPIKKTVTKS